MINHTNKITQLDPEVEAIALALWRGRPSDEICRTRVVIKFTPAAQVAGQDFDYWGNDGQGILGLSARPDTIGEIYQRSRSHWELTQQLGLPRWYKMIVTVDRSGNFSVEFEYKDDYKEGDIMQRG